MTGEICLQCPRPWAHQELHLWPLMFIQLFLPKSLPMSELTKLVSSRWDTSRLHGVNHILNTFASRFSMYYSALFTTMVSSLLNHLAHLGTVIPILLDEQIKISWWLSQEQYLVPWYFKGLELFHWHYSAKLYADHKNEKVGSLPTQPEDISW